MNTSIPVHTIVLVAGAFAATLLLAGLLTPRGWWRRLTLGNLALVLAATWAIAAGLLHFLPAPVRSDPPLAATAMPTGRTYRVADALNLRASHGTASPRLAVVPAGSLIQATGLRTGDWLQLRARIGGRTVTGWSNSLWLRRTDEAQNTVDVREHRH
jgi:hypothetical protein